MALSAVGAALWHGEPGHTGTDTSSHPQDGPHFVGYGLVNLAFFYSWRQTLHRMAVKHWNLWRRASVLAVLCTLVIASLDEYHQSFLPSRTSSPIDVGIDLCGAIAFQLVLLLIIHLFARRHLPEELCRFVD
jgi:VanZ family protein